MIFQMWSTWNKLQFKVCQLAHGSVTYLNKHSTLDSVMVSVVSSIPARGNLLKFFKPLDVNFGLKCKCDLIVKNSIVSQSSAKDQLIQWKHEAEVSLTILKTICIYLWFAKSQKFDACDNKLKNPTIFNFHPLSQMVLIQFCYIKRDEFQSISH